MTTTSDTPPASAALPLALAMLRCRQCGALDAIHTTVCAGCLSHSFDQVDVEGRGKLASWTVIRRAPTRFREQTPYQIAVVDLDSGPRITGRLGSVDELHLDQRVRVVALLEGVPVFEVEPEAEPMPETDRGT